MFDIGTRIVVLASSTKKGFGAKRGSIGYVSNRQQTSFINHIKPHRYLSFLITPTTIAFSRYGYEEKRRCEFRNVLNVTPAFVGEIPDMPILEVEKVVSIFQGDEFEKNRFWGDWASDVYGSSFPKLAVLAPVGSLDLENMLNHPTDVEAWMESILRSQFMGPSLAANRNNGFYPWIDSGFVTKIANAHRSRSTTQLLTKWALENAGNLENMITYIRTFATVFNLRTRQSQLDYFKQTLKNNQYGGEAKKSITDYNGKKQYYGGGPFNFDAFFNIYMSGFFEDNIVIKEKEVIAAQSKSKQIREIAKCMRYVRSAMTELVPKTIAKE